MAAAEIDRMASSCQPWDVIVLGAGPAGAVAARQLALRGRRVLLVEKAQLPRFKPCGGCLGGAALEALDQLGLGDLPSRCGAVVLRRMRWASGGRVAEIPLGRRVALSRSALDDALVRQAACAGVVVCDGTRGVLDPTADSNVRTVRLLHDGAERTAVARIVLMATGLGTVLPGTARRIWRQSWIGLGTLVPRPPEFGDTDVLRMACSSHGYVGLAAVAPHHLHVGAAVRSQALAQVRAPGRLADRILRQAGLPAVPGLERAAWQGTPRLTHVTRPLGAQRCLLVGDAAGYVEPFTGEGIGWAIQSAVLASRLADQGLGDWDPQIVRQWQRHYEDLLAGPHRRCRAVSLLLRSATARRWALMCLQRTPALAQPLVRRLDRPLIPGFP
jgi:flavin-dependent dehydrogenase